MSNTANPVGSGPKKYAKIPCNILLLVFTFVLSCLVDWMIALSHSNKEKTTHIGHFYTVRSLSSGWKIHTLPQQPGTSSLCWSPTWSHVAVGWHSIPQPGVVAGQPSWLCWSLTHTGQPVCVCVCVCVCVFPVTGDHPE